MRLLPKLKSPVSITLIFVAAAILVSDYHFRWKNEQWKYVLYSDAGDYYAYLPMVFITHNYDLNERALGVPIKHYIGTAVFHAPFFGAAYLFSKWFGFEPDGFSKPFQVAVSLASLFYLLAGLFYLRKFLKFYAAKEWHIIIILLASVITTCSYYYAVIAPGWSHTISFMLVAFLLYHSKKLFIEFNRWSLCMIPVALSFLFWTRPTDVVVALLLPFIAGDKKIFFEAMHRAWVEKRVLLISFIFALLPAVCQLITYKLQTGNIFIWAYGTQEKFDFTNPEILNVLFSYTKGLFVYTPVCFVALFGLIPLWKNYRFEALGIILFSALNIYIISSWWCWNYGVTFGSRAFMAHFPVFFFMLALLLRDSTVIIRSVLIAVLIFFAVLNSVQMVQCERGILDVDFSTDKRGFWETFFKTDGGYSGKYYRTPVDSSAENIVQKLEFFNDMEKPDTSWINNQTLTDEKSRSGKFSSRVNRDAPYSSGIIKRLDEIPYKRNVLIRVSGWFNIASKGSKAYFAISFSNDNKSFHFNPISLDKYVEKFDEWEYDVFELYMPRFYPMHEKLKGSKIEFYMFNDSGINCYVDDLKIEITEYKKLDRILDVQWE
jgi:hypothetical protein